MCALYNLVTIFFLQVQTEYGITEHDVKVLVYSIMYHHIYFLNYRIYSFLIFFSSFMFEMLNLKPYSWCVSKKCFLTTKMSSFQHARKIISWVKLDYVTSSWRDSLTRFRRPAAINDNE